MATTAALTTAAPTTAAPTTAAPTTTPVHDRAHTWAAMGTSCRALVVGAAAGQDVPRIVERVEELEARWSRFRADSDVTRLNEAGGHPVELPDVTLDLLELADASWRATGGAFDPTVLPALEAAGYHRSRHLGHGAVRPGAPAPGLAGLRIDRGARTAQLPAGVRIDLGGIGKGRAADLVARELATAPGGLVDLGGDLRVWGRPPAGTSGWPIAVEDPRGGNPLALLGLADGAVASSSTLRRRWEDRGTIAHHLIDPRSGRPTTGEVVAVTVVAALAAPAEVLAKAAIVTGTVDAARALLERHRVDALIVPSAGPATLVGGFAALCWEPPEEHR